MYSCQLSHKFIESDVALIIMCLHIRSYVLIFAVFKSFKVAHIMKSSKVPILPYAACAFYACSHAVTMDTLDRKSKACHVYFFVVLSAVTSSVTQLHYYVNDFLSSTNKHTYDYLHLRIMQRSHIVSFAIISLFPLYTKGKWTI